jgi:hypothetical protein
LGLKERVGSAPLLAQIDGFADADTCAALLALWGDAEFVEAAADYHGRDRCSFVAEAPANVHPLLQGFASRLIAGCGVEPDEPLCLRFRYYQPGEGHPPHLDHYVLDHGLTLGLTALLPLVDTELGGATVFPSALPTPLSLPPKRGRLLLWWSQDARGEADPHSLHAGEAVAVGHKAVLLAFFYLRSERIPQERAAFAARLAPGAPLR